MFSSPMYPLATDATHNTAGEAMDDLLDTVGMDDVFDTLDEELTASDQTPTRPENVDGFEMEPDFDSAFTHTEAEAKYVERASSVVPTSHEATDMAVEDTSVGLRSNVEYDDDVGSTKEDESALPLHKTGTSQLPTPTANRYPTRHREKLDIERKAADKTTKKEPTRFSSRLNNRYAKVAETEPTSHKRLTARAAVLQAKLKKNASSPRVTKFELHDRRKAKEILRNWQRGAGLAVVTRDEVDRVEYEKVEVEGGRGVAAGVLR